MSLFPHPRATRLLLLPFLLLGTALTSPAADTPSAHAASGDTTWIRGFAIPADQLQPQTPGSSQGHENGLNGDPRFDALLRSSFHQRQWFWHDHGSFIPVADLVHTFIGVPGDAVLTSGRYVTANGCVPHDCTDLGMLWIDTGVHPASLLFAATQLIVSVDKPSQTHLWIFASRKQNFEDLPPDFLASLKRWRDTANADKYLKSDVILATLVQPTGEQVDLTYDTLFYKQNQPGAKK